MKLDEYRRMIAGKPIAKPNKYGAVRTPCAHGHQHDSAREAKRCAMLHLEQRVGSIDGLEQQPFFPFVIAGIQLKYPGGRRVGVTFDFAYRSTATGRRVAEDSKGHRVRDWPLRRAVFEALYPDIEVRET